MKEKIKKIIDNVTLFNGILVKDVVNSIMQVFKERPISMVWIRFDSKDELTQPIEKKEYLISNGTKILFSRWTGSNFDEDNVTYYANVLPPAIYYENL